MSSLIQAPPQQIQIGGGPQQGGGAPPPGMGGPQPGPQRPPGGPGGGAQLFIAALKKIAQDVIAAQSLSDDPLDKSDLAKCAADIHKMIAGEQQETDKMMGGGISPRAIRRGGTASGGY